jgi:PadR family transcriptional regulator PadR
MDASSSNLKGNLDLVIMSILRDTNNEMYGLEIAKAANERSDGLFSFAVGSLYPALHGMVRDGLLTSESRPSPRGGKPIVYYTLTEKGQAVLAKRQSEFERFTSAVRGLFARG